MLYTWNHAPVLFQSLFMFNSCFSIEFFPAKLFFSTGLLQKNIWTHINDKLIDFLFYFSEPLQCIPSCDLKVPGRLTHIKAVIFQIIDSNQNHVCPLRVLIYHKTSFLEGENVGQRKVTMTRLDGQTKNSHHSL